jgi:hypothetical protein
LSRAARKAGTAGSRGRRHGNAPPLPDERWLAELQRRCPERGVFCSLDELTTALEKWIKLWNENARPFKWTTTPDQIIDRICRYCSRISEPEH